MLVSYQHKRDMQTCSPLQLGHSGRLWMRLRTEAAWPARGEWRKESRLYLPRKVDFFPRHLLASLAFLEVGSGSPGGGFILVAVHWGRW